MENSSVDIGKNITRLREQRSLTIRDLAIKSDIAENSLSAIEHGKKGVGLLTLIKLADALNVSLDYLVGRDGSQLRSAVDEDKAQFMAIMSDLYDKYFKLLTPSAISTLTNAETRAADASVDVHSDGSADRNAIEKMVAVNTLKNVIKAGIPWKDALWTCVRLWQGEEFRTAGRGCSRPRKMRK